MDIAAFVELINRMGPILTSRFGQVCRYRAAARGNDQFTLHRAVYENDQAGAPKLGAEEEQEFEVADVAACTRKTVRYEYFADGSPNHYIVHLRFKRMQVGTGYIEGRGAVESKFDTITIFTPSEDFAERLLGTLPH